ncbi:MAG: PAS domain S-box protein, partial [Deltaproteobacteria bacterium]|nr:PAS domain S-box protein [Deltaproteobacteria bacterium]
MNADGRMIRFPSGTWHLLAVIATTFFAIAVSAYYLSSGRFIVFQNLFYFPIIIACIYYLRKGFVFSVLLAFFYFFLIVAHTADSGIIREALIRVLIFIIIAGVVTFISLRRRGVDEEREQIRTWQEGVNRILGSVLAPVPFDEKLKRITDGVAEMFGADFCRIWLIGKGDLCSADCMHAGALEGPHVCRYRDKCLHLKASSGRYTHIDGKAHRRVPFGAYKIGRIASGEDEKFLTNDVQRDPRVHDHEWAKSLGLAAFAGYRLKPPDGETLGVFALFAKFRISPDMDAILEGLSRAIALVIQKEIVEQALAESEDRYRAVVEDQTEIIFRFRTDGTLTFVNDSFCRFFAQKEDVILGTRWQLSAVPDDVPEIERKLATLSPSNPVIVIENRVCDGNGTVRWMQFVNRGFFDDHGQLTDIQSVGRDITDRRRAEEALIRIQKAVESSSEAIGMSNPQGSHFYQNKAFLDLFEYSVEELDKPLAPIVTFADPEVGREVFETIMQGAPWVGETIMVAKGGRRFPVFLRADAVKDDHGDIIGLIGIHTDITERKLAEEKLNNQLEFITTLLNTIPIPVFFKDTAGIYLGCNRAFEEFYGMSREEVIGKSVYDMAPIEIACKYAEKDQELFERPGSQTYEWKVKAVNGSVRGVIFNKATFTDSSENVAGLIGVILDITERKQVEQRLGEEMVLKNFLLDLFKKAPALTDKELYDYVLDHVVRITGSTIGFFHLVSDDQENVILTTWNTEALKNCTAAYATHYPLEQAGNWVDCVRLRRPVLYNDFPSSPNQKGLPEGHTPIRRFMSVPVVEGDKVRIIFGVGNKSEDYRELDAFQIQVVANDLQRIMAQRRAEAALSRSEANFRSLIENAADIITILNADGIVRYMSPSLEHVAGFKPSELTGRNIFEYVHPDDVSAVTNLLVRAVQNPGVTLPAEFRLRHNDGSWHIFEITAQNLLENEAVNGIVVNSRDITDRKQAEEALRKAHRELRESKDMLVQSEKMAALGQLVTGADHEFRNPLSIMAMIIGLLETKGGLSDDIRQNLETLKSQIRRIVTILDGLRDFSSMPQIKKVPNDINEIVRKILAFNARGLARDDIAVEARYEDDLPPAMLDADMMERVLTVLLTNAADAMRGRENKSLRVITRSVQAKDRQRWIRVVVSDVGSGIKG